MSSISQELTKRVAGSDQIYFVCSGNIIRSSFAHIYAQHLDIQNIGSFGTRYHNREIHPRSAQQLKAMGVSEDIISKFKPTHIESMLPFEPTDIFLIMTQSHLNDLLKWGIASDNIFFITELIGTKAEIADPYFDGNYDEAYQIIRNAVDQLRSLKQ